MFGLWTHPIRMIFRSVENPIQSTIHVEVRTMQINTSGRNFGFMNGPRFLISLLLLLGYCGSISFSQITQVADDRAEQVKAIFIFNFTQFIEWPRTSFASSDAPFVITVLDDPDFSAFLRKAVEGELQGTHPIVVQDAAQLSEVNGSHILFFGRMRQREMEAALADARANHTLTVSDQPDFVKRGGIIRFFIDHGKIRIRINRSVAKASGLTISSKLLNVAEVVEKQPN